MALLIRQAAVIVVTLAAVSSVLAQAPVVDLSENRDSRPVPAYGDGSAGESRYSSAAPVAAQQPRAQTNPQAEAYYQMQVLQQEVRELRGAVEELRHEIKRLKQQRTDDYMDLDRRISRLSGEQPSPLPEEGDDSSGDLNSDSSESPQSAPGPQGGDERERYQASFGMAREGDYVGASVAFKRLLADFPNGKYAPNANYWLGEIALVQGDLEGARQWFVALLDGYPNSTKVWDGRYKLGTVYHQLGDDSRARELLEQVAASDARAAGLAKQYLQENLQQ
ncbi:YbgF trimerization domain-containing protein [Microbulbifer sp. 2201CG32-9]|uniref:YbgF trimerization domain-containing protein n=1 Tax=Microbulbifer sp. 2201CG32-9 TaxID=3232309 RepID=UPI00345B6C70